MQAIEIFHAAYVAFSAFVVITATVQGVRGKFNNR